MFLIKLPDQRYINVVSVCPSILINEFSDKTDFYDDDAFSQTVIDYYKRSKLGDECRVLFDNELIYLDQKYILVALKEQRNQVWKNWI